MILSNLTELIHKVDAKRNGCCVVLYTINDPAHKRGRLIGHVSCGRAVGNINFETERGLIAVLRRLSR